VTLKNGVIHSVVASFQHAPKKKLRSAVTNWLKTLPSTSYRIPNTKLHINPAGDWDQGGFDADAGLTGRKLIVDNYGPRIPIGGGAFSGKDPSKVDRSAAYMARRIALDYLEKRGAHEVYVYLAYAIGYDQPLEATVVIDGKEEIVAGYDLTPRAIINQLRLKQPIYEQTARYGHFGHRGYSWDIA
jgi:S-adenosylmethionine synthetase